MIKEVLQNIDWILFLHIAGIIIALGAVTVIDTLGFFSRKSKSKTQITIGAHHITKPLIWIGTILVGITWIFMVNEWNSMEKLKTILLGIMILNGSFLSFHISPRLNKLIDKKVLLQKNLQIKIAISLVISFITWWSFVILTIYSLS